MLTERSRPFSVGDPGVAGIHIAAPIANDKSQPISKTNILWAGGGG